jgi:hypothetical protein
MDLSRRHHNGFSQVDRCIGKGEVHSSILCGSTIKTAKIGLFSSGARGQNGVSPARRRRSDRTRQTAAELR